jgi:hypothetical protein
MASATSREVAFGLAMEFEFLRCEQLRQAIEKYQKDCHGHHNHIVADAAKEKKERSIVAERTLTGKTKGPLNNVIFIIYLCFWYWGSNPGAHTC